MSFDPSAEKHERFRRYGPRPIPDPLDDEVTAFVERLEKGGPDAVRNASAVVSESGRDVLQAYAGRVASQAVRRGEPSILLHAVVALVVAGLDRNYPEALMGMALIDHSAMKIGADLERILEEASAIVGHPGTVSLVMWISRAPEKRTISVMGYAESEDDDGFRYRRLTVDERRVRASAKPRGRRSPSSFDRPIAPAGASRNDMLTEVERVRYPSVRRNLLRSLSDLASEAFGHPDHWPEWTEAARETTVPSRQGETLVGDTLVSRDELASYRALVDAIGELPEDAWQLAFGEVVLLPEWARIRRGARDLYETLTPNLRRRLRLAARAFAIEQVVPGTFLDYRAARSFVLQELPAQEPEQLMGYVLLVREETDGYGRFADSVRALRDNHGMMPFSEVVQLEGWPNVSQAARELYGWLKD